jgi:hypothetical protein
VNFYLPPASTKVQTATNYTSSPPELFMFLYCKDRNNLNVSTLPKAQRHVQHDSLTVRLRIQGVHTLHPCLCCVHKIVVKGHIPFICLPATSNVSNTKTKQNKIRDFVSLGSEHADWGFLGAEGEVCSYMLWHQYFGETRYP